MMLLSMESGRKGYSDEIITTVLSGGGNLMTDMEIMNRRERERCMEVVVCVCL